MTYLTAEFLHATKHVTEAAENLLRLLDDAQEDGGRLDVDSLLLHRVDDKLSIVGERILQNLGLLSDDYYLCLIDRRRDCSQRLSEDVLNLPLYATELKCIAT